MIGAEFSGCGEAEGGEEGVGGEHEAGEDGEVEGHEHGEVAALVDRLHHPQQEGLQHLEGKEALFPGIYNIGGQTAWREQSGL